jgi:transmembrane sensor
MDYEKDDIKRILDETKKLDLPDFDEHGAWENISTQITDVVNEKFHPKTLLKYAAVIFFGVAIGILVSKVDLLSNNDKFVEINATKGQKIDISLPDGNKIWINSNSNIKYPANFEGFNKKIYVSGEAYFEFTDNAINPVFVIVNNVVVQSFNAAFNIKTSSNNMSAEITVTKGWLSINNPDIELNDITIEEGYTCFFSSELPLFIEENKNVNYLAWKTGELHFKDTPLKIVAATLSEFYEIPIQIDGRIQYCNFSSDYKNVDIKTILKDIQGVLSPYINIQTKRILIRGDDC